jgi:hypothetical protein
MSRTVLRRCHTFACIGAWAMDMSIFPFCHICSCSGSGWVYCVYGCVDYSSVVWSLQQDACLAQQRFLRKAETATGFLYANVAALRRHSRVWQQNGGRNGKQSCTVIIRVDGCLCFITSVVYRLLSVCLSVRPSVRLYHRLLSVCMQAICISLESVSMLWVF